MSLMIVAGPHEGFWVKDGDKVVAWCWCRESAERMLREMAEGK